MATKGVYKITNIINNKVYIGKSLESIEKRWRLHKTGHGSKHLFNSIKKYGIENFKFEIIEVIEENINEVEIKYIDEFKSYISEYGYNKTLGGEGQRCSDETREKIRFKALNKSQEWRDNISKAKLGRKHSQKTINKIKKSKKGTVITNEHRKKLSVATKNYWARKKLEEASK